MPLYLADLATDPIVCASLKRRKVSPHEEEGLRFTPIIAKLKNIVCISTIHKW